jgi:hypothetical protein
MLCTTVIIFFLMVTHILLCLILYICLYSSLFCFHAFWLFIGFSQWEEPIVDLRFRDELEMNEIEMFYSSSSCLPGLP